MTEIDENIAEAPADFLENKEIMEALENLQISGFTKAELETYDKYWDSIRTEKTLHSGFYEKGMSEGRVEEKKEIAKAALKMGMSIKDVSLLTGLNEEEIKNL
jgi:predicted transposase YdaD